MIALSSSFLSVLNSMSTVFRFIVVLMTLPIINSDEYHSISFSLKEESALYTTIGNISDFLMPKSNIVTDSLFFNVTPTGLIQLSRRLDMEALCTEKYLCCEHEKPCELISSIVVESQLAQDVEAIEVRIQVLDVNDNAPAFPVGPQGGQRLEVSELAKVGSVFDLVPATDRDVTKENQIQRYLLHGAELQRMFELDRTETPTARLRLIQPLDYEKVTKYVGLIEACDPQYCAQQNLTILVIDANDNRPFFLKNSYQVTIPENFSVGQTVLQLEAQDKDSPANAHMDFRFHGDVDVGLQNTFRLERDTGRIVLRTHLAAHKRSEYRFDVSIVESASDVGQTMPDGSSSSTGSSHSVGSNNVASILITVEDLNDFSPIIKLFSPSEGQRLSIPENTPATRVCVLQVTDNDADDNGRVSCRLLVHGENNENTPESLTLTSSGKMYTLTTSRSFDAELEPQVTVTLACTDHGYPPRSSSRDLVIHVEDINEYAPELDRSTYHAAISENSDAGVEVVRIIAHDRDVSAKLYYELSAQGKQYFSVDTQTGAIVTLGDTVAENRPGRLSTVLDREKSERITFTVCVSDGPFQGVCDSESVDRSQPVRKTHESSLVVYTVRATVFVTVLDQNDNRPNFIETGPFSVAENQPRFTQVIGKLLAIDPDEGDNGRIRYSLRQVWRSTTGTAAPDLFQVDVDGRIQTLEVLDREVTDVYTLELSACDSAQHSPLCSRANVSVTILDENDNKPVWRYPHDQDKEVNITSDLPPGHIIARVHATDRDADENGRIVYSLIDPLRRTVFQVDNRTGDIIVAHHPTPPLSTGDGHNRETTSPLLPGIYRLRMKASDQGHPQQTAETWLQVNVFSVENGISTGMNFLIIVIMVAVTGLISVCLVVAIICVRRRSLAIRAHSNAQRRRNVNGLRHGRDAADGAECVHFPLKHEYGYPLDGTGYMMGVSPTPSDLDGLKLGYSTAATLPCFGVTNGGPDAAHLIGWPSGAICYPADDQFNFLTEDGLAMQTTDLGTAQNLRLPIYAPYHLKPITCSEICSVKSAEQIHPQMSPESGCHSVACLSFVTPCAIPNQLPTSSGLNTFGSSYSDQKRGAVLEDVTLNSGNSGSECPSSRTYHDQSNSVVYDASYPSSRQGFVPILSSANSNMVGTSRRHYNHPHYELDVESADSGKGASEDDPSLLTGTSGGAQLFHAYPAFQLTTAHPQAHFSVEGCEPVNGNLTSGQLNATNFGSNSGEHAESWTSSERQRLKC